MGIETTFNHLQIYVSDRKISFPFYKELLTYMGYRLTNEDETHRTYLINLSLFSGYRLTNEDETHLGMRNGPTDIWLKEVPEKNKANRYHRKNVGVNHLAFGVSKKRRCR